MDKLILMLWKNLTVNRRNPWDLYLSASTPLLMVIFFLLMKNFVQDRNYEDTYFPAFDPTKVKTNAQFLIYSPYNKNIDGIVRSTATQFKKKLLVFNSSRDLSAFVSYADNIKDVWAAVQFDDSLISDAPIPKKLHIRLRFPEAWDDEQITWATDVMFPISPSSGPRERKAEKGGSPHYQETGFLALQQVLCIKTINYFKNFSHPKISMRRFPVSARKEDTSFEWVYNGIPDLIVFSYVSLFVDSVTTIVLEKESQIFETLKIYGVSIWIQWLAHFIYTFLLFYAVLVISLILLCIQFTTVPAIFGGSSVTLLLVFFCLFACSSVTYSFLISTFCSSADFTEVLGLTMWYGPAVIYRLVDASFAIDATMCVFSSYAAMHGFSIIFNFQMQGSGANWSNFLTKSSPNSNLNMGYIFLFLLIDTIVYMALALYIIAVFPGKYGVPKVWYFPLSTLFCRKLSRVEPADDTDIDLQIEAGIHENEPANQMVGVSIRHLYKSFGKKVAVNDLSLDMYVGQITALLGHNGAGKTTTLNILIGMIQATKGSIIIDGVDVSKNPATIRGHLGFCPQHNILFQKLTVEDHIYLFSRLKGVESNKAKEDTDRFLRQFQLKKDANTKAGKLSGGMKRKLSIGIALCGDSKIIVLDEPTAGVDPSARRNIWNLLIPEKKDRTIVFTTHYMDEADVLGDRIAIMVGGRLKCSGSGFFLKKKFGSGYQLTIAKLPGCNSQKVQQFIAQFIPGTQISSDIGSELRFTLPSENSSKFESFFRGLEQNSEDLKLDSFGLSLPTIEEVFLKVGTTENFEVYDDVQDSNVPFLNGVSLYLNKLSAMLIKKLLIYWKSWWIVLLYALIPIVSLVVLLPFRSKLHLRELPALKISLQPFDSPVTLLNKGSSELKNFYVMVLNARNNKIQETADVSETMIEKIKNNFYDVRKHYVVGATFLRDGQITGWFNGEPYHAAPVSLDLIIKALTKQHLGNDYSITVWNDPLPVPQWKASLRAFLGSKYNGVLLTIAITHSIIVAMFMVFVIKENANGAKHQQFVSGVGSFTYWVTHLLFDMTIFVLVISCVLIVFRTSSDELYRGEFFMHLFFNLLIFGWFAITLAYLSSLLFSSPSNGFWLCILHNSLGLLFYHIANMLERRKYSAGLVGFIRVVSRIFPSYTLYSALDLLVQARKAKVGCSLRMDKCFSTGVSDTKCQEMLCNENRRCCEPIRYTSGEFNIFTDILVSLLMGTVSFVFVILIDSKILRKVFCYIRIHKSEEENYDDDDDDVAEEKNRVRSMQTKDIQEHGLVIKNLTMRIMKIPVVNNISFAIKGSECFGLLGTNGAGKTTAFKMMTGDYPMSSGDIWIGGFSMKTNISKIYTLIGYCPQSDALFEKLTGKENLIIYGLIRGVPYKETEKLAVQLSKQFDFNKHLNKQVRHYSGGNKRKLNACIAFLGNTDVIFLDEPTAGMDPATRRYFWNVLCKKRDKGKCIILTSHNMEECEALCTKIAIMVAGSLKCLGSIQHLKNKYAKSFTVTFKVNKKIRKTQLEHEELQEIENFISVYFPTAKLQEQYQEMFIYQIDSDGSMTWSKIFRIMEDNKQRLHIDYYSVTQSSLERVFLSFS